MGRREKNSVKTVGTKMKNHNLQSFNRIINSEGSSVIGASLFNFLWWVCFNPVQTTLAKISYYSI